MSQVSTGVRPPPLWLPSCKFMATCLVSAQSLWRDSCTPFYVADNSKWRQRRQIRLWEEEKKKTVRKRERQWVRERERWQKGSTSKFRAYHPTPTHAAAHISLKLTHSLVMFFHPQEDIWLFLFFLFFCFSVSLLAGYDSSSPCPALPTATHLRG